MLTIFRAFSDSRFAWLWSGQTISRLGDSFYRIALAWWVLEKTGSAAVMGATLIASTTPMLLFSLLGGAFVDRLPRALIMVVSDVARCLGVGLLAALSLKGDLRVWHILVVSVLFGAVDAFFLPAYRAIVAEMLEPGLLNSANSLTTLSSELSGIIGPTVAAVLIALGGSTLGFALDALSFLISLFCLLPVLGISSTATGGDHRSSNIFRDIRTGLSAVLGTPWIWIAIAIAAVSNLTYAGPMGVALPFLIRDRFESDVHVLGYFYTSLSVGSVLAAVWVARYKRIRHRGPKLYGVWLIIGLMVAGMALPLPVEFMLGAAFVIGAANTILSLLWLNSLQELVPRDLQGRVSSIDYLGSSLLEPVGYGIGAWATALLGPVACFAVGGLLQSALISLGLLHPQVRSLD